MCEPTALIDLRSVHLTSQRFCVCGGEQGHYISFVRGLSDAPTASQRTHESKPKRRRQNRVTSRFAGEHDGKQWFKCDDDSVDPEDAEDEIGKASCRERVGKDV